MFYAEILLLLTFVGFLSHCKKNSRQVTIPSLWLYKKLQAYLQIHFSNELERLQGKPANFDPLLKTGEHQKNLKKEQYQKAKL